MAPDKKESHREKGSGERNKDIDNLMINNIEHQEAREGHKAYEFLPPKRQ